MCSPSSGCWGAASTSEEGTTGRSAARNESRTVSPGFKITPMRAIRRPPRGFTMGEPAGGCAREQRGARGRAFRDIADTWSGVSAMSPVCTAPDAGSVVRSFRIARSGPTNPIALTNTSTIGPWSGMVATDGTGSASPRGMRPGTGAAPVSVGRSASNARPTLRRDRVVGWADILVGRSASGASDRGAPRCVPRDAARARCGRQQLVPRDQPQRAGVRCRSRGWRWEMHRRFVEGRRFAPLAAARSLGAH